MGIRYSEAFIEQALIKVYSRGERTIQSVAEELNVNCHTVKNWMKIKRASMVGLLATKERRPQDWTTEQQLVALRKTRRHRRFFRFTFRRRCWSSHTG
ncbi:MAG: transposase [Candidatus Nitrotoga sp.]|nr:transposase [Candidatus Nitrotoga sp.]